jgi:hypothetical protein
MRTTTSTFCVLCLTLASEKMQTESDAKAKVPLKAEGGEGRDRGGRWWIREQITD